LDVSVLNTLLQLKLRAELFYKVSFFFSSGRSWSTGSVWPTWSCRKTGELSVNAKVFLT